MIPFTISVGRYGRAPGRCTLDCPKPTSATAVPTIRLGGGNDRAGIR